MDVSQLRKDYPIVLSNEPGGRFLVRDSDMREGMALICDPQRTKAVLLYSASHFRDSDPRWVSLRAKLRESQFAFEARATDLIQIRTFYAQGDEGAETNHLARSGPQQRMAQYIREVGSRGGSDLRVVVTDDYTRVSFKLHRRSQQLDVLGATEGMELVNATLHNMCAGMLDSQFDQNKFQDAQFKPEVARQLGLDNARISTVPAGRNGTSMVIRLMPLPKGEAVKPAALGFLAQQRAIFRALFERSNGLVLINGQMGTGKSTTLMSVLDDHQERIGHTLDVLTIEDPIEYTARSPAIVQTRMTGSWKSSLKAALRQAVDIIMPSEIRDDGSASIVMDATMTGHMCWSTIHCASPFSIPGRLIGMGVSPDLCYDATYMAGMIGQQLVRRLCPHCSRPATSWDQLGDTGERLRAAGCAKLDGIRLAGAGCGECEKGFRGMIVIADVIQPTQRMLDILRHESIAKAHAHWVKVDGGITRQAHLLQHIRGGVVDPIAAEGDFGVLDAGTVTLHEVAA